VGAVLRNAMHLGAREAGGAGAEGRGWGLGLPAHLAEHVKVRHDVRCVGGRSKSEKG
jgi:hypothetical protein